MAEIRRFGPFRHLRGEASSHVLKYRQGRLQRSGRGLAFWFMPMSAAIAEVPIDNREVHFVFHGRSADFQDVTAQGVITYRVTDPEKVAERVDFSLDLSRGAYRQEPLEKMSLMITQLAQQLAAEYFVATPIRTVLAEGIEQVRLRVSAGLAADPGLTDMGVLVVTVRLSAIKPSADLEKAIEAPVREQIQQQADEAAFGRRALAVQNERAIRENELQNEIELAKREAQLIEQQGKNSRRKTEEEVEAARIHAQGESDRQRMAAATRADALRLEGGAEADKIRQIEEARASGERQHMDAYRDLPASVLWGLAARELGRKLERIDHLNLTPDVLSPLLANLVEAGTRRLEGEPEKRDKQ